MRRGLRPLVCPITGHFDRCPCFYCPGARSRACSPSHHRSHCSKIFPFHSLICPPALCRRVAFRSTRVSWAFSPPHLYTHITRDAPEFAFHLNADDCTAGSAVSRGVGRRLRRRRRRRCHSLPRPHRSGSRVSSAGRCPGTCGGPRSSARSARLSCPRSTAGGRATS